MPQQFIGDETKLFQILTNLIDNAIKFTEKGEIIISVDLKNDEFSSALLNIAEDNETNQILLQRYLERVNIFEVDIVDNGKDAVKLIKINSYDLILMDIQMPIVDGIEDYISKPINKYDFFSLLKKYIS